MCRREAESKASGTGQEFLLTKRTDSEDCAVKAPAWMASKSLSQVEGNSPLHRSHLLPLPPHMPLLLLLLLQMQMQMLPHAMWLLSSTPFTPICRGHRAVATACSCRGTHLLVTVALIEEEGEGDEKEGHHQVADEDSLPQLVHGQRKLAG